MFPKQVINICKTNRLIAGLTPGTAQHTRNISNEYKSLPKNKNPDFALQYEPLVVESGKWDEVAKYNSSNVTNRSAQGAFHAILPLPNIRGNQRLGHVLTATIQDAICRYNFQNGLIPVCVPGLDDAGVAVQLAVEDMLLKKRGLTRLQLGKATFLEEVRKWNKAKNEQTLADLKKLGCAVNWDRHFFTMDKAHSQAVDKAFIQLFDKNLMQRKQSLVNWSCTLESAIPDSDIEYLEVNGPTSIAVPGYEKNITFGKMWDIKYRIFDTNQYVTVSTTRPDTMMGDVAVAVHPDDPRYFEFQKSGEVKLWHPFRQEPIPLIFDLAVDRTFGTGVYKITPAHDKKGYEIAQRHALKPIQVFNNQGKVLPSFETMKNLQRFDACETMLNMLTYMDLLVGSKDHAMMLPLCCHTKDVVEFMLRDQWVFNTQELARSVILDLQKERLRITPSEYKIDLLRWLENCQEWGISRQFWWGHQIPAYFLIDATGKSCWVAAQDETQAKYKAKLKFHPLSDIIECRRDDDVLDTWFSSALMHLTAFGWPNKVYRKNLPLNIIVTGHDVLFPWAANMAIMGKIFTGRLPFHNILVNGILRDMFGRESSENLKNIITPEKIVRGISDKNLKADVEENFEKSVITLAERNTSLKNINEHFPKGIPECGTDALRLTLCSHDHKSPFMYFSIDECHSNKLFLNKLWEATHYTLSSADRLNLQLDQIESLDFIQPALWTRWILSRLATTLVIVLESFRDQNLHGATAVLKQFLCNDLCDIYLELTKPHVREARITGLIEISSLATGLSWGLKTLYPFTPFICKELLSQLRCNVRFKGDIYINPQLEAQMNEVLDVVRTIRQWMSIKEMTRKHEPSLYIFANSEAWHKKMLPHIQELKILTNSQTVTVKSKDDLANIIEGMDFVSTAGHLCSFAVQVNHKYAETTNGKLTFQKLNVIKLTKLQKDLDHHKSFVSDKGFKIYANKDVQKQQHQKIKQLEIEIEAMKTLANDINMK